MIPPIAPRLPRSVDKQVSTNRAPISFLKQFECFLVQNRAFSEIEWRKIVDIQ